MADDLNDLGGYSLFDFDLNWAQLPKTTIAIPRRMFNFPGTSHVVEELVAATQFSFDAEAVLDSETDIDSFLDFITARDGRVGAFWIRHPFQHFTLDVAATNTDGVLYCDYNHSALSWQGNERIYIDLVGGDTLTFEVDSINYNDSTSRSELTLATNIDRDIAIADIVKIGRLLYVRFGHDSFKLEYLRTELATVDLKFVELIQEYP